MDLTLLEKVAGYIFLQFDLAAIVEGAKGDVSIPACCFQFSLPTLALYVPL